MVISLCDDILCGQVILDGHGDHQFNAHVQEVKSDSESAVVFVEELGERSVEDKQDHYIHEEEFVLQLLS